LAPVELSVRSLVDRRRIFPLGSNRGGGRFQTRKDELAVNMIESGTQFDALVVADHDHPTGGGGFVGGTLGEFCRFDPAPGRADALDLTDCRMDGEVDKSCFGLRGGHAHDRLGFRHRKPTFGNGLGKNGKLVQCPTQRRDTARPTRTELAVPCREELDRPALPLVVQSPHLDLGDDRGEFGLGRGERAGQFPRTFDQLIIGEIGSTLCELAHSRVRNGCRCATGSEV
jgi:hypothetical protein